MNWSTSDNAQARPTAPVRTGPRPLLLCHAREVEGLCLERAITVDADAGVPVCLRHALGKHYAQWSAHRVARLSAWAREDFGIGRRRR